MSSNERNTAQASVNMEKKLFNPGAVARED